MRLNHYRTGEYNEDNCRAASSRLRAAMTAAMTPNDRVEGRDACGASLLHAGLCGAADTEKKT